MPTVAVDGADLYYEEHGTGDEVVVCCQQWFTSEFPAILSMAPTSYHVFTLVCRGYHPSSPVERQLGAGWYPRWAEDVHGFARALRLERFVYTGVSHGALIGWHLALAHPEDLKALVSIVGAPQGDRDGPGRVSHGRRMDRETDPVRLRTYLQSLFAPPRSETRRRWRDALVEADLARMLARVDAFHADAGIAFPECESDAELAEFLGRIRVPVLLMGGLHDPLCKPEYNLLAARAVRGAKLVLFEEAGHRLAVELPDQVVGEFRLFIDQLKAGA